MSAASGINVDFFTISQAQTDVMNTVGRVDGQLDELRAYLAPMIASWSGGASSDYQALQKRWDTAAADLNQVLAQIGQLLGQTHDSYQTTERSNANAWG